MNVTLPFEFHAVLVQTHLFGDGKQGAMGACRRPTDVITVNRCGPTIQAVIAGVADKAQPYIIFVRDLVHQLLQVSCITDWQNRLSILENNRRNVTGRRFVDACDGLSASSIRTQARLIRQLLERIVIPKLDFHSSIQGTPHCRIIRSDRPRSTPPLALDSIIRETECVLGRQSNPQGNRL